MSPGNYWFYLLIHNLKLLPSNHISRLQSVPFDRNYTLFGFSLCPSAPVKRRQLRWESVILLVRYLQTNPSRWGYWIQPPIEIYLCLVYSVAPGIARLAPPQITLQTQFVWVRRLRPTSLLPLPQLLQLVISTEQFLPARLLKWRNQVRIPFLLTKNLHFN